MTNRAARAAQAAYQQMPLDAVNDDLCWACACIGCRIRDCTVCECSHRAIQRAELRRAATVVASLLAARIYQIRDGRR